MPTKRLACLLTCLLLVLTLPACGREGGRQRARAQRARGVGPGPSRSLNRSPSCPTQPPHRQGCEVDVGARRPIAVMLNNLKKALPQVGVSQADVIYEILAEGASPE